jgi:hypothetical protein
MQVPHALSCPVMYQIIHAMRLTPSLTYTHAPCPIPQVS